MTIINLSHKFVFVHIPKTAGTSIKNFLDKHSRYCDIQIGGTSDMESLAAYYKKRFKLGKHSFAREIRHVIGGNDYTRFYKFSFVRNPYTRTLSTFKFLKYSWKNWGRAKIMDQFSTPDEFVASDFFQTPGPDRILEPQMSWLTNARGQMIVDFVGYVETLDKDINMICDRLGLVSPTTGLDRKNVSKNGPDHDSAPELSEALLAAIRKRYAADFEGLGYSANPCETLAEPMRHDG